MSALSSLLPFQLELSGDIDTPVSAYLKLSEKFDPHGSFLLESVSGQDKIARYSFIGFKPICEVKAYPEQVVIRENSQLRTVQGQAVDTLETVLKSIQLSTEDPSLPALVGGAVGFFSWEVMTQLENLTFKHPQPDVPLGHFVVPSILVVFDHAKRKLSLITLASDTTTGTALLKAVEVALRTPISIPYLRLPQPLSPDFFEDIHSNVTKAAFMDGVEKTKQFIHEGDIFQLVLSQKFQVPQTQSPMDMYRKLRQINPSPYMFLMNFRSYHLVGASPEVLVKLEEGTATVRPIAGTRPRQLGQEEALIEDMLNDEKEIAEHIMLVDLGRNDLGRVCENGSVKVTRFKEVETYSHVLHMVSNVEGKLAKGKTAFDLFKATFPAGTLSGAPKIRAIELIDQLETDSRGTYGGALGYIDRKGNMDFCIMIRTILVQNGVCTVQAGAGLVADSVPLTEYEESCNKAKGILQACVEDEA